MKKIIFTLFALLIVSILQVFGQNNVPPEGHPNATRLYLQDFGGNDNDETTVPAIYRVADKAQAQAILGADAPVSYGWGNYGGGSTNTAPQGTSQVGDGHWALVKFITGPISYPPWFANIYATNDHRTPPFQDHTSPVDGRLDANNLIINPAAMRGYMMLVNGQGQIRPTDPPDQFYHGTINNLCTNVRLCISVYVGNLIRLNATNGSTTYYRPKLGFAATTLSGDSITLDDGSKSFSAGPIDFFNTPTWVRDTMWFTNMSNTSIIFHIFNTQTQTNGNDMVLDDIEVWEEKPDATIQGSTFYCANELTMNLSAPDNSTFETPEYPLAYQWLYVPTAADTVKALVNWEKEGTSAKLSITPKQGFYKLVLGSPTSVAGLDPLCCSVSWATEVKVGSTVTLYWRPDALNRNWNDPQNWQDLSGAISTFAPTKCNDVHIPGTAAIYPDLNTTISGISSACRNIWFHFGGLIGQPHLLDYDSAYVQYNFGISTGAIGKTGADVDPVNIHGISYSAPPMNRGQWYALSAPLQKIASGDFAVGGYPKTWQQGFITSSNTNNQKSGANDGTWYTPVNTDDWDIGKQYNAIAIWAGEFTDLGLGEGTDFQTNLDGLKGIIEMPYFENSAMKSFHTEFKHEGGTSYFPYFYNRLKTPGVNSSGFVFTGDYGHMARAGEAYRFIFQGPAFTSKNVSGDSIYTMKDPVPTDGLTTIMIGNPFFSNLDFNAFAQANGIDSYRLYVTNSFTTLPAYSITAGSTADMRYIAPLQAFFIEPITSPLVFNADKTAMADEANARKLRSSDTSNGNMKADVLYLNASSNAGQSWLTLSMQNVNDKNLILLLPDGYPEVPQIYATDKTGQKNAIQFEGGYVGSVPLGVLSSDSAMVTLTVQNADNMAVDSLILWDKYADKKVDLKTANTYTFKNVPSVSDRFVLITTNKSMTGITATRIAGSILANVIGNTLYVSAASGIADVSLISFEGVTLSKATGIGQNTYTKTLNLPKGAYLVSVKLTTGETRVVKIIKN